MPQTIDNGPRWPARPTIYRGIRMRSRLEARFAAFLDSSGRPWRYEPTCFADETGQYLPDFLTWIGESGRPHFWELKGWEPDPAAVRQRMEIILASEPAAVLSLEVLSGQRGAWTYLPGDGWVPMPVHGALA